MFGIGLVCSHHTYEADNLICPVFLTSAHENSLSMLVWSSAKECRRLISNKEERTVSTKKSETNNQCSGITAIVLLFYKIIYRLFKLNPYLFSLLSWKHSVAIPILLVHCTYNHLTHRVELNSTLQYDMYAMPNGIAFFYFLLLKLHVVFPLCHNSTSTSAYTVQTQHFFSSLHFQHSSS